MTATATATAEDKKNAQDILDKADETLALVDKSYIFLNKASREFPQFEYKEIGLGSLLGKGGFSGVHEIDAIILNPKPEEGPSSTVNSINDHKAAKRLESDDSGGDLLAPSKQEEHKDHYDVKTARQFMCKHYLRHGSARYAIKKLKSDLGVVDRARGAVDLAIEIKFLRTIWHPNIIKMRGYSKTPRVDTNTFLILDRLYGTLDDKIEQWDLSQAATKSCCGLVSENDPGTVELLKERLLVAYDLSNAISYLHDLRLLYRDLKPENIGFDVRGDVKLFDFGLMKSLERSSKVEDGGYGYNLSAKTGSIPYMAPEVALGKPYDREADVYSFSVLLWEVISLNWAFNGYDAREYFGRVCVHDQRLPMKRSWPAMVRVVIEEGWDPNPQKRPNMSRIGSLLRAELGELTSDAEVAKHSNQLLNRSLRSRRFMNVSRGRRASGLDGSNTNGRRASALGMNGSNRGGARSSQHGRSPRDSFVAGDPCP